MKLRAVLEVDYDSGREVELQELLPQVARDLESRLPELLAYPSSPWLRLLKARVASVQQEAVAGEEAVSKAHETFAKNALEMIQSLMYPLTMSTVRDIRDAVRDVSIGGEETEIFMPIGVRILVDAKKP